MAAVLKKDSHFALRNKKSELLDPIKYLKISMERLSSSLSMIQYAITCI